MSRFSLRRALSAAAACAALALLGACGASSTASDFTPQRLVAFGDAFADQGQSGSKYTVNDTAINHWLDEVASRYALPLKPSSAGGLGYGRGSARVAEKPDLAGNGSTLTVTEQVDAFLATQALNGNELVVVVGGISDVAAEYKAFEAGSQTADQMTARIQQAGKNLAAQARRLVAAGAKHVVVVGSPNLGYTPWAGTNATRISHLTDGSLSFNEAFLVAVEDLGQTVLYIDAAYYFNLLSSRPSSFGLNNAAVPVCTSVDAGAGIGLGAGQVNSALCTASTVLAGVDYNTYVYADLLYPAPRAHRLFGDYAYDRIRNRW